MLKLIYNNHLKLWINYYYLNKIGKFFKRVYNMLFNFKIIYQCRKLDFILKNGKNKLKQNQIQIIYNKKLNKILILYL